MNKKKAIIKEKALRNISFQFNIYFFHFKQKNIFKIQFKIQRK
jgi:hypothetical protein